MCAKYDCCSRAVRHVIIVDLLPGCGDWCDAAWDLHEQWQAGAAGVPCVCYLAIYRKDDVSAFAGMKAHIQGMLLARWWESQSEAGPSEPTDRAVVPPPLLRLLALDNKTPRIPDVLKKHFEESADFKLPWQNLLKDVSAKLSGMVFGCDGDVDVGSSRPEQDAVAMRGPEFLDDFGGGHPIDPHCVLEVEVIDSNEMDMSEVCPSCQFAIWAGLQI